MMRSAQATHTGHKRDHNEDAYLCAPELNLWLVADGMGGHEHGEVASALARDSVQQAVADGTALEEAVRNAGAVVCGKAMTGYSGMGTTMVAARMDGDNFQISWVGDSRGYLFTPSDGKLSQLTRDHSYVQELMDGGAISTQEAEDHPHRHVITQALGVTAPDALRVDTVRGKLRPGDQLLLCSDGLNSEVEDDAIAKILTTAQSLEDKVVQLIGAALEHGGSDNVTVVLLERTENDDAPRGFWRRLWGG